MGGTLGFFFNGEPLGFFQVSSWGVWMDVGMFEIE